MLHQKYRLPLYRAAGITIALGFTVTACAQALPSAVSLLPTAPPLTASFSDNRFGGLRTLPSRRRDPIEPVVTPQAANSQESGDSDLASKVVDPTAPLKTLTFQNRYTDSFYGASGNANEIDFQLGVPLQAFGKPNIFRITVPYVNKSPFTPTGLSDTVLFDIVLLPQKWGIAILGADASFGVNRGNGVAPFSLGPVLGAVWKKPGLTYGVFNQNLFSSDVAISQFQPIIGYTVNKQVSLAIGDAQITLDWNKGEFVKLPLALQVNYITLLQKQPIRLFINPQYNVINESGQSKFQLTLGFALIVP